VREREREKERDEKYVLNFNGNTRIEGTSEQIEDVKERKQK
jgi:hypothetical protein